MRKYKPKPNYVIWYDAEADEIKMFESDKTIEIAYSLSSLKNIERISSGSITILDINKEAVVSLLVIFPWAGIVFRDTFRFLKRLQFYPHRKEADFLYMANYRI